MTTYLQLDVCLSNVLCAAAAGGDLLRLGDLRSYSVGAELVKRVALGGVDAEYRVGLDSCETTGD